MLIKGLKKVLKNLKGDEVKNGEEVATIGKVLAQVVLTPHKTKDGFRPLQAWQLAQVLHESEQVELTDAELLQIGELLETTEAFYPFVIGQIQEHLIKEKQTQ